MRGIPGAYLQDLLLPRRKPRTRKAAGRGREGGRKKREEKESKMEADVCRARSRGDCLDVP